MSMRHSLAMVAEMPLDFLKENATQAERFVSMPLEVMVRFGMWNEILAEPNNYPEYMAGTRAFIMPLEQSPMPPRATLKMHARSKPFFSRNRSWYQRRKFLVITPRRLSLPLPREWSKA